MVYVLNSNKEPLMPCCNARARILLKYGRAKVVRRTPFTIQLLITVENPITKDLQVNVDPGSGTAGYSVTDEDNKVYYLSEVTVRNDIKPKMDQRREYRRTRRNRKTRHRKCRNKNRKNSCKKGRVSPTVKSKQMSHKKEIEYLKKILPIKDKIVIERGNFDTHLMQNPELKDKYKKIYGYQKGKNYGYSNTKEMVKSRDSFKCQHCKGKSKDNHLEVHHIIFRSNGGSDLEENLITLCHTCHRELHAGKIKPNFKNKGLISTLKHATHMNAICCYLFREYPNAVETFGYITKENRLSLNLPKEHCIDSVVIGTQGKKPIFLVDTIYVKRSVADSRYQQTKGKHSEIKLPNGKIKGFKTNDKVLYRGNIYFIKGMMSTGYAILSDINGTKVVFEKTNKYGKTPKLSDMKRISATKTILVDTKKLISE